MDKTKYSKKVAGALMVFVLLFCIGCATVSNFDQYAYTQTTSLKGEGLNLMSFANDDFSTQEVKVRDFQVRLQKMIDYEKSRPKNDIAVKLWEKLLDSNGHLLGGFLKRWENESKLTMTFINDEKLLVDEAFDQIAKLETKKNKTSK